MRKDVFLNKYVKRKFCLYLLFKKLFYDINDFGTLNETDTWVPVLKSGTLQHRVIPKKLIEKSDGWTNFSEANTLNIGYDSNIHHHIIQLNYPDGTAVRLAFNSGGLMFNHYNGTNWTTVWNMYS